MPQIRENTETSKAVCMIKLSTAVTTSYPRGYWMEFRLSCEKIKIPNTPLVVSL